VRPLFLFVRPMQTSWIKVGKVKDAQGLGGELFILLFAKEAPWLKKLQQFALSKEDQGPFEIHLCQKARTHKEGLVLKSTLLQDRTQAEAKKGLQFFVPAEFLESAPGETIFLKDIHGFQVQTSAEIVGPIIDFSTNGAQDLLIVDRQGVRVEIPFVEAFIDEIDFVKKLVKMTLPEGLWDL